MRPFLSSTYIDLVTHRAAATEALERLGLEHQVVRMEIFGARSEEPHEACLREVRSCDLFVGIYAHRYGFVPEGELLSITEQEFDEAQRLDKPTLCFVVAKDYAWPPTMIEMDEPGRLRLAQLKKKISKLTVRQTFTDPTDLAFQIAASVGRHLQQTHSDSSRPVADNPYSTLLESTPDLAELVDRAVEALQRATRTDYNQVFLVGRVNNELRLIEVAYAISDHKLRYRIASLDGLIGSVFVSGRALNARAVQERPNYLQAVIDTRAELIVPIESGGVVIGVFNSESEVENYYTAAMCAEVDHLARALGPALTRVGWQPSIRVSELPHVGHSLDGR